MRRAVSVVIVSALVGAAAAFGGSAAAVADDDADDVVPSLADALAAAADDGADTAAELAAAVGLPEAGAGSLAVDASGDVAATVTFDGRPSETELDAVRALATIDTVYRFAPAAAVTVASELLDDLADLPGVVSVVPVTDPAIGGAAVGAADPVRMLPASSAASRRAFPSDALEPLAVDIARTAFDVDGTGVTVGVISDSFGSAPGQVTDPAEDVALGVLPGPGNPCGYDTPVTVLADLAAGDGTDEGRAMLQLVHGIAPGAELLFHTGQGGAEAMADAIVALAEAGADIIVDDLAYLTEPHFQQGFDEPASPVPAVSWAQPVYGLTTSLIPQLYIDGAEGAELVSGLAVLDPNNPVIVAGLTGGRSTVEGEVDLVILRPIDPSPDAVPSTPAVWTFLWGGHEELAAREYDTSVGEDRVGLRGNGHAADGSAIGVAAVNWRYPDVPEEYSSPAAGTVHLEPVSFGPDAAPVPSPAYPAPLAVPGPWIAAVDGNRTSFFGDTRVVDGQTQYFFFGTSAAAPNAAAVHALALDRGPTSLGRPDTASNSSSARPLSPASIRMR